VRRQRGSLFSTVAKKKQCGRSRRTREKENSEKSERESKKKQKKLVRPLDPEFLFSHSFSERETNETTPLFFCVWEDALVY